MEFYMWRDAMDNSTFLIGSRTLSGGFTCWACVFIDGVQEMFGQVIYDKAKLLGASEVLHVTGDVAWSAKGEE